MCSKASAMDLLVAFRTLVRPNIESGPNTFSVMSIGSSPHRLGKDGDGAPVLLIRVPGAATGTQGPVVLQHIAVQHDVRCWLVGSAASAASHEEVVSLVRCTSGEGTLREYFVHVVEIAVLQLGNGPTRTEVNRAIKSLTELFRAFEQPARRTVQGLWAELVVIVLSEAPGTLVSAWHVDPNEAFDFAWGPSRIEVKSFSGIARIHSFTLRQVHPGAGVEVVIASIRAERCSGGTSIADLMRRLLSRGLTPGLMSKVELVVAQSLGDNAGAGLSMAFDLERACESVCFFDATSVPSVDPLLPAGVVSVSFESMLAEDAALHLDDLRTRGALFRDVTPAE